MINKSTARISVFLLTLLSVACTPGVGDESATLEIPTPIFTGASNEAGSETALSPLPAAPTFEVPGARPAEAMEPNNAGTAVPTEGPQPFQVAYVESDDVLNMRSGPGVDFDLVQSLPFDATGIFVTGPGQTVVSSTWLPISADGQTGWVNSRFLSETVEKENFCQDDRVQALLEDFGQAVTEKDDAGLAALIHPERGLRIGYSWWNPQILLREEAATDVFSSSTEYDWGIEDGSGNPITGSFSEVILPLLQDDFLAASEIGCDEIIHGGTAGLVQLPDGYEAINFYSFFRPGTEKFSELDWGSWVVGIEQWQGAYYLSFLVHFAWEI